MSSRKKYRSVIDSTLGHRLWGELSDTQGRVVAFAGQWVDGELLEAVKTAGLEEELLCAVLGILQPPKPVYSFAQS